MNKQNLSKSELAAIDLMIAHMQDNNKTELGGFWDSITSAVETAASVVSSAAAVVAARAATAATAAATDVAEAAEAAAPVVAEVTPEAAVAALAMTDLDSVSGLVQKLNSSNVGSLLTLDNLIKIRNQYSK
jgi:Rod binding domain-containing protein